MGRPQKRQTRGVDSQRPVEEVAGGHDVLNAIEDDRAPGRDDGLVVPRPRGTRLATEDRREPDDDQDAQLDPDAFLVHAPVRVRRHALWDQTAPRHSVVTPMG